MNCAKCGMELPDSAKYCPGCGLMNEAGRTAPPRKRKTKPAVYAIVGLAAIALIALAFVAIARIGQRNVTAVPEPPSGPPGNILSAPPGQASGGNITSAPPGAPGPGDTAPSSLPRPKPPKEVVDYLNFVKRVEEHRQMLLKDTTDALAMTAAGGSAQSLLNLIDMASDPDNAQAKDPLKDTKDELNRQYKNWLSTLEFFDKQSAPAQCREFSGAYRDTLYREAKALGEIAVSFNSVNMMNPQDMSKLLASLQKMKKDPTIQQGIDQSADNADAKLTQVVSKYDMKKPFNVPRERQTSGNIMGF